MPKKRWIVEFIVHIAKNNIRIVENNFGGVE